MKSRGLGDVYKRQAQRQAQETLKLDPGQPCVRLACPAPGTIDLGQFPSPPYSLPCTHRTTANESGGRHVLRQCGYRRRGNGRVDVRLLRWSGHFHLEGREQAQAALTFQVHEHARHLGRLRSPIFLPDGFISSVGVWAERPRQKPALGNLLNIKMIS